VIAVAAVAVPLTWNASEIHYANCISTAHVRSGFPVPPSGEHIGFLRDYDAKAAEAATRERRVIAGCSRLR
jgi:hypothetical protein